MSSYNELMAEYREKTPSSARNRLTALFDGGVFFEIGSATAVEGRKPSVITAHGCIENMPAYAFSIDSSAESGAIDSVQAQKIVGLYELAGRNGVPVIGFYDSLGAFINDGADALNAYSAILAKAAEMSGVVPTVSVINGICSGSLALIAVSADHIIMTADSQLYFEPNTDSTAESAAKNGLVSMTVADDTAATAAVKAYLSLMPANNLESPAEFGFDEPSFKGIKDAKSFVSSVSDADSVTELYADYGTSAYTALAGVSGMSAGFVATNKSADKLTKDDLSKIARLVRLCDAFGLPVITFVDSKGIEKDAALSLAKASAAYAEASVPKLAVVKNAVGAVFTAFAGKNVSADSVIAVPDAVISPIAPLTAAEFLYHDKLEGAVDTKAERDKLAADFALNSANAFAAAAKGAVDDVADPEALRSYIVNTLDISRGKRLARRIPKKHGII